MLVLIDGLVHLWKYKVEYSLDNNFDEELDDTVSETLTEYIVSDTELEYMCNLYPNLISTPVDQSGNEWINGLYFCSRQEALDALNEGLNYYRRRKLSDVLLACNSIIISGCDVQLSNGETEHFSLLETDQINLNAALAAVREGMPSYPYHADGQLCKAYSGQDIIAIATAASLHKLYHTTYCNHLNVWINRADTTDELMNIYYGTELPKDLSENMQSIVSLMGG